MGYRAVAITEHTGITIPQWFMDKWSDQLNIEVHEADDPIKYLGEHLEN